MKNMNKTFNFAPLNSSAASPLNNPPLRKSDLVTECDSDVRGANVMRMRMKGK